MMQLEIVLNELSHLTPVGDRWMARQRVAGLLATLAAARKTGFGRTFRFHPDLYSTEMATGYTVADWLVDSDVSQDLRTAFKGAATASPFFFGLEDSESFGRFRSGEFRFQGELAEGLGAAYLLDALAVSFQSDPRWDAAELALDTAFLDEDAEIEQDIGEVKHASTPAHAHAHQAWIDRFRRSLAVKGQSLWDAREMLFPHLQFCASTQDGLERVLKGTPEFLQLRRKLSELEEYCRSWSSGPFDASKFPGLATPESDSTLKAYPGLRTFRCPDGNERLFSWHVRFTPGKGRIHFVPLEESQTMIIGYIGPKLPTSTNPT